MNSEKPKDIDEYKNWLKKKHEIDISDRTRAYYESVTSKVKLDFEESHFWVQLTGNLREFDSQYFLEKKLSNRKKTVSWIEGKILSVLSQRQEIPYLSLSASVLRTIRSTEEEDSFDIALINLLSRRQIYKSKNGGKTIYRLVA